MRRLLLILGLVLLVSLPLRSQQGNTVLILFPGVPSGTCSFNMLAVDNATGDLYDCDSTGNWNKIGPGAAGAVDWDSINSPSAGNQSLAMANFLTDWVFGAATGVGLQMFDLRDTTGNTGTGYVLSVSTTGTSAAKPIRITDGGLVNGVEMDTAGVLLAIGTGSILADNLAADTINATTDFDGALCGTTEILEDQGAAWACIATPTGGGGLTHTVNGVALASATALDFDDALPAAPANSININWAKDALDPTNISASILMTEITQTGTITSGTWNGTIITPTFGGTGQDFSAATGVTRVAAGTFSADAGISHLASSTSADLEGVLSDETGSGGFAVFASNPRLAGAVIDGGNLDFNDGVGDSPQAVFIPATGTSFNIFVEDTGDDLQVNAATVNPENVDFENTGTGLMVVNIETADGVLTDLKDGGHITTGTVDESVLDPNVVLDNASNTYSTGAQNFTSATSFTTPVAAGAAPTASGQIAYDSTAQALEYGDNTVNRTVVNTDEAQTLSTKTLDSTNVVQAGAYDTASIDGDDINSNLAGSGLVLTVAAPDTLDIDLIDIDDQVGSASNQSGMEFGGTGGADLGLLRGCTLNQILKFNTTGGLWECAADVSGGSPTLDTIAAAAGSATINNGDNAIVWNWSLTTASRIGFQIGENVASVATTDPVLFDIATLAASTAHPLEVTARGTANGIRVQATDGVLVAQGTGGLDWPALLNYPTGCTNQFVRTIADTLTCNTVDLANDVTGILDESNLDANVVLDNAANAYSTGAQDFTSATSLTTPVAAGAGPTASGQIAFDSTAQQLEYGDNAVNRIVVNTNEAQTLSTKTLDSTNVVQAGAYDAASIDGDDIDSGIAGTGLTLTVAAPDTLDCDAASTTAVGCPEMAVASEVNTGTSTILAVTPDALAGSVFGQVEVQMVLFDFTTAVATGDGAFFFHIASGSKLIGMDLIDAVAAVITVSSSGLPTVDIARCAPVATGNPCSGTVADTLTVNLTIDVNEDSSDTATTGITINTAADDVIVDQTWRLDVDVAGTGTQGLIVTLIFQLP